MKDRPLFVWSIVGKYGLEFVIALRTLPCSHAKCTFCELPTLPGITSITNDELKAQIDYVFEHHWGNLKLAEVVSIYVAGSVFDLVPMEILEYLTEKLNAFPNVKMVSFENRHEFITSENMSNIKQLLPNKEIEMAVGVEVFDEYIRNEVLKKDMKLVDLSRVGTVLADFEMSLKVYGLLGLRNPQGPVVDILKLGEYLKLLKANLNIKIRLHINPFYIPKNLRTDRFEVPTVKEIAQAGIISTMQNQLPVYIGMNSEGLDEHKHYSFEELELIRKFNIDNDIKFLDSLV